MKHFATLIILFFLVLLTSRLSANESFVSCHPLIASDATGRTVALWMVIEGDQTFLKSAVYFPNGGWSTPTILSTKRNKMSSIPQIAINAIGQVVVVWKSYSPNREREVVEAVFSSTEDGEWSTPIILSDKNETSIHDLKVSIDQEGHSMAIWCSQLETIRNGVNIRMSVAQHNAVWSAPLTISN